MTALQERTGTCLCGAVRLAATPKSLHVGVCHCDMCRQWGGGPMFAIECEESVRFEGDPNIGIYPSSEWAERGFCRHCGTHLFYRLKEGGHYAIPVGLLKEGEPWQFAEEIFIDRKPAFYSFAESTRKLTEAEVFAHFEGQ